MRKNSSLGKRKYIRDGRAPIPRKEITSRIMSSIRAKDTTPELLLRKALRAAGLVGYRLYYKKAPGRPDIAYPSRKIAIFVHGCFWHRCPYCKLALPKSHKDFWREKFRRNKERDRQKILLLRKTGWKVLVFWECQIKSKQNFRTVSK
jgi:DNA mismatch endonuclease (patch repair protein)